MNKRQGGQDVQPTKNIIIPTISTNTELRLYAKAILEYLGIESPSHDQLNKAIRLFQLQNDLAMGRNQPPNIH